MNYLLPSSPVTALVVSGKSSQQRTVRLSQHVLPGCKIVVAPFVSADPTAESVQALLDFTCETSPDWVIAMGGGSVLDSAKAAAVLANNEGSVLQHMRGEHQIDSVGIPLVAIPTTAGSGSEVTPFASITDSANRQKISLSHDYLFPRFALLDPALCQSLPAEQTAISGMDALSHAIEGYWSNRATSESDSFGMAAAAIALEALPNAYNHGDDFKARHKMLEASYLAGLTISCARTTAVHAVSYPLTVHYGVPHGTACGMLLPSFIRYNSGNLDDKKETELLGKLGMTSMQHLASTVESLKEHIGLPSRLSELGITQKDIGTIVANGYRPDRMSNNPREISAKELTSLLESIL